MGSPALRRYPEHAATRRGIDPRVRACTELVLRQVEALRANEVDAPIAIHLRAPADAVAHAARALRARFPAAPVIAGASRIDVGPVAGDDAHWISTDLGTGAGAPVHVPKGARRAFVISGSRWPSCREL